MTTDPPHDPIVAALSARPQQAVHNLLDMDAARTAAQAGIDQSAETSGPEWAEYARLFVRQYLRTHERLHVDDLWDAGLIEPTSARALGAVIQHAIFRGWMSEISFPNGTVLAKPSVRSHGGLKRVYTSNIYEFRA